MTRLPLYRRIYDALRAEITDGTLPPGTRLPNEFAVGKRFRASQGTARRALMALEQDGLLRREQGKGSWVKGPGLERFVRLRNEAGQEIQPTRLRETLFTRAADPDEADALGTRSVIEIQRLYGIDGKPTVLERLLLDETRFAQLATMLPLPDMLYSLYATRFGTHIRDADEDITARMATAEDAHFLNVRIGAALLITHRRSRAMDGRTIELRENRYVTGRLHYAVGLR